MVILDKNCGYSRNEDKDLEVYVFISKSIIDIEVFKQDILAKYSKSIEFKEGANYNSFLFLFIKKHLLYRYVQKRSSGEYGGKLSLI